MGRSASAGILVLGILMILAGAGFAALYVAEAVVLRWVEADQSPIFWYLPILFAGLIGMVLGGVLAVFGKRRLKRGRP